MKICAAQIQAIKGDIAQNIHAHKQWIFAAVAKGADFILFPELSLTSYEPELAEKLAVESNDPRLDEFQEISNANRISIGLGAPVQSDLGIQIGMFIFQPDLPCKVYAKQYLHSDEQPFFVPGNQQVVLNCGKEKIAPAICYESLLPEHAADVLKLGASIYVASVAKPTTGVAKSSEYFPQLARKHSITVMMANAVGFCDTFESAGLSAVWNTEGEPVGQMGGTEEGLLMVDLSSHEVSQFSLLR